MGVKCQWFDDDGHPVLPEGCRFESNGCTYIHPTSHLWKDAQRRRLATVRPPTRGGGNWSRGGREVALPSTRDSGWGGRNRVASGPVSPPEQWDTQGWKPTATRVPAAGGSVSGASPVSSRSADPEPARASDSRTAADDSGWGSSSWATSNGGWGTGAWGDVGTTTTSADAGTTTNAGNAWGDTKTDTGTKTTNVWGTPTTSPSITQPPPPPTRPTDLHLDTSSTTPQMQPLTASSSHRASSQAPSSVPYATPQSTFPQFSVPSAILPQNMTRAQIHAGVIKNTVRVIRIKLEIAALNRKLTDWTATQSSSQFRRVSEATGVRLNSIHGSNKTMLQQAESRLRHAEDDLQLFTTQLNSSSMAEAAARDYDKVQTQVIAYTTELTEWIRSFTAFDAHANRPAAPPPAPRRPSDSYAMDVDTPPLPEGPVANLQRRIAAMEETLEETKLGFDPSDIVDTERTSRLIEEAIAAVRSEQGKGKEKENMDPIDDAELRAAVDQSKKQFDQLAEQAVVLLKRNRHLKETVGLLTAEREKHRQLKAKLTAQFERLEAQQQARRAQLAIMTEEFALLLAKPKPLVPPTLDPAVVDRVKDIVEGIITAQVIPVLKGLGEQYTVAIARRMEGINQAMQPALDEAERIRQRAAELNAPL